MIDRLTFFFFYSLGLACTLPALFPSLRLFWFAPLIVLSFYQRPRVACLWLACVCGFVIDLFSSYTRFGLHALNYCLTATLLYPAKSHFFEDSPTTLPGLTWLFVITSTVFQALLLKALGQPFNFSWEWIKLDLIWMPFYDALYAGIAFALPLLFLPSKVLRKPQSLFSSHRGL